jgi:hypothetical protein
VHAHPNRAAGRARLPAKGLLAGDADPGPASAGESGIDTRQKLRSIMANMNRWAFVLVCCVGFAATLSAAGKPVPPFKYDRLDVSNGSLVESVCFYDQFREHFGADAWVRVLQWGAREDDEIIAGHAVAVFEFEERLWTWDMNFGFIPLDISPDKREDVGQVSRLVLARYPRITACYPLYRSDYPQEPAANPVAAMLGDAGIAAERLAQHRPVNLVQYSYVQAGETKTSAVAVFMFNSRLCIYFPEAGTVPFLTRQKTVENMRLLQECIRRVHPGAFALKPL